MLAGMSAPLDFLRIFAGQLRQAGIPFAITSGMACVHYGLQQNTKDSDWIIPADDLVKLRELFSRLEGELPPWRVSYRQICGAPLDADWMAHGWTSHLSIWDSAGSVEHKVDLFSKPPRVKPEELIADPEGWSSQHVVAQMKKTDRPRDWPIVDGLGQRLCSAGLTIGLLHINHPATLRAEWVSVAPATKEALAARRPLLRGLDAQPSDGLLERWLLLERLVWERVNDQRYSRYTRAWKNFYRQWRKEESWEWPTAEPFRLQHRRLTDAARRHGLPCNPLENVTRAELVAAAVRRLGEMGFPESELAHLLPPVDELLP
jgi:hypothetical protein